MIVNNAARALAVLSVLAPVSAFAQGGDPGFFIPPQQGGGQGRPAQAQPAQRPAQQPQPAQQRPAQRPVQPNPQPLPPGQPPPDAVIGIVDIPEVQRNSTAFNQVREEIERRRQRLNEDLQREQQKWRDDQQALAAQRASLAPEALRTREREMQERITESQRVFRDRSRGIESVAQTALQEIEQALAVVVRQVASSRRVNIVLPRALVIVNEPPFDLTDEISAQLNRVLRSVSLAAEGTPPPPPAPPGAAGQQPPAARQGAPAQAPAQAPRRN